MRIASVLLLLLPTLRLAGQTADASVVASAERIVTAPGLGEAVFLVQGSGGADSSVASVSEALAPAGIASRDLVGRSAVGPLDITPLRQGFLFRVVQPVARYQETLPALRSAASASRALSIAFRSYTRASQADIEQARAEVLPELFRQTKAQAERMLIEAGYRPGAIVELNETMEPSAGSNRVRFSLSMRMARLGAPPTQRSVSTVVTPQAAPYRVGPPVLLASFFVQLKSRQELLALVQPAGLTEAHLTQVEASPDTFNRDRGREPQPMTRRYYFTAPIAEADIASRLGRLPRAITASAEVTFPVEPAPLDSAALAAAARSRAALLAGLLGGQLGDGVRVGEVIREDVAVRAIVGIRRGDFSGLFSPQLGEPAPHPTLRYQFAIAITAP